MILQRRPIMDGRGCVILHGWLIQKPAVQHAIVRDGRVVGHSRSIQRLMTESRTAVVFPVRPGILQQALEYGIDAINTLFLGFQLWLTQSK